MDLCLRTGVVSMDWCSELGILRLLLGLGLRSGAVSLWTGKVNVDLGIMGF
jgi:hypothetical protein